MPRQTRYARIAITLPADDLATADRLARERDRPRSWLIAEAVRRYAAHVAHEADATAPNGLGASRRQQLMADLRLTPEQRVRAAERTAGAGLLRSSRGHRVIGFDRYEDYLAWKRLEALGA